MGDPKVIRTKIDEGTAFVSSPGRSAGRRDVESFTTNLVRSLRQVPRPRDASTGAPAPQRTHR